MQKIIRDQEFHSFLDRNSGKTFSDIEFQKCHFIGCAISITHDIKRRSKVRNVRIIDCEQHGCALKNAIVEEVLVNGFKTNGLLQSWGAVFNHVVITGKIGRVMISSLIDIEINQKAQDAFDEANKRYYENIDWAIDIREALFEEADLRGIPGKLILRDPQTQFLLTREKALEGKWKNVDLTGTYWKTSIEFFLKTKLKENVLVAPKLHPRFRPLLAGLWALRDQGVFEDV